MELITSYIEAKSKLDYYKALEAKLRIDLLDELFPAVGVGTHKDTIGDFEIKGVFKNNIKIDAKELSIIKDLLSDEELDCIRYKAELKAKEYNALSEDERSVLDEAVVITPAMPTLTVSPIEQVED